jgi:hypothetical protein
VRINGRDQRRMRFMIFPGALAKAARILPHARRGLVVEGA